jgi:hypothetical protein
MSIVFYSVASVRYAPVVQPSCQSRIPSGATSVNVNGWPFPFGYPSFISPPSRPKRPDAEHCRYMRNTLTNSLTLKEAPKSGTGPATMPRYTGINRKSLWRNRSQNGCLAFNCELIDSYIYFWSRKFNTTLVESSENLGCSQTRLQLLFLQRIFD